MLEHYEYAANGAVLCFRDLNSKSKLCAPHGLEDKVNCIAYQSPAELMHIINSMTDNQYNQLLLKSYEWVENNTTIKVAKKFLSRCGLE